MELQSRPQIPTTVSRRLFRPGLRASAQGELILYVERKKTSGELRGAGRKQSRELEASAEASELGTRSASWASNQIPRD